MSKVLQPTHITALDEILGGGIPIGSVVLLSGPPGSGKTILASQWLFAGQKLNGDSGLFIAATESVSRAKSNLEQFDFFSAELTGGQKVHFTDLRSILKQLELTDKPQLSEEELEQVIIVMRNLADRIQAKRVVIDSITALLYKLSGPDVIRNFIFKLGTAMASMGTTILMISEADDEPLAQVEKFIADGVISIQTELGSNSRIRRLEITKMRGVDYRSGPVMFDIAKSGIVVYPKIPTYRLMANISFTQRVESGIPALDDLMDGGYPQGHMILIGGNTGSGKSTFTLQFMDEGVKKNEPLVMVALEESVTQIKKSAAERGWDFDDWESRGLLSFVTTDLIDIYPDKLLYEIVHQVKQIKAKRVVIDSLSSMESGIFDKYRVREFMLQITAFFKSRGITCVMTYLTTEMFGSVGGQLLSGTASNDLRLSSIVDGIILLRYVERDQQVKKLMSILKMRGSSHDKSIREFEIDKQGIHLGGQFER